MDPDGELFVCFLLTIVCNRLLVPEAPAANHLGPVLHRTETAQAGSPSIWFTFSFSLSPQHHHLHSYTNTDNHILRLNSLLEQTLLWNFLHLFPFLSFPLSQVTKKGLTVFLVTHKPVKTWVWLDFCVSRFAPLHLFL